MMLVNCISMRVVGNLRDYLRRRYDAKTNIALYAYLGRSSDGVLHVYTHY